eukprot:700541-Pleurochrysis_carterae.AAC.1
MQKLTESYIDALYYFEKWKSAACWKTAAHAEAELVKLKSKTARAGALKEQIRIRVLGLLTHLKTIIALQRTRSLPTKPPVQALERKSMPQLGKRTTDVAKLDAAEVANSAVLEASA